MGYYKRPVFWSLSNTTTTPLLSSPFALLTAPFHYSRIGEETMVSVSGIMDVPTAILLEIFLKLPVYAITRCKSVCKSWTRLEPRVPDCLDAKSDLFLSGSSKDFLCLCESKYIAWFMVQTVYISNPITGECIALPPHRVSCRDRETTIIQHKFDFSPSTDNFKVMRFVYTRLHSVNDKVHVEIFTVGVDDHWRCLKEHSIPSSLWSGGFIFNGAYHWIKIVYKKIELICTFDLGKEKEGRVINLPPLLENLSEATITSFNNRFSLVIRSAQSHITIWTMTEYGVDSSWTKDVILQSWFPSHLCFEEHFPVAILRNGAIIFKRWGKNCLFCCDTKKKKTATIKLQADVGVQKI
ncbi:hypothetical protein BUALT_Bualt10G0079900 [Buddleja alternifolia]|uniref:F-box domain-containing protein n=1 Tax=Buddleja alternifolia TaxID=168488 RepID=A0AAV6X5L5_9LAMI|nr:hypothetical protein BUALT_Bualt10G0079900 [Buddleja alternifolia]